MSMRDFAAICPREELKQVIRVRNAIIEEYAPLIRFIAMRIHYGLPATIELDDLLSIGALGLIDAIDKYDMDRGVLFKTYAENRIRGKILDELRKLDWLPRGLRQKNKALERAYHKLGIDQGNEVSDSDLAQELGIQPEMLSDYIAQASGYTMLSLDEEVVDRDGTESGSFGDMMADEDAPNPQDEVEANQVVNVLKHQIQQLSERERQVIALYYYEELTMKEIGTVLDITESRVSQIHSKALGKLRQMLDQDETTV